MILLCSFHEVFYWDNQGFLFYLYSICLWPSAPFPAPYRVLRVLFTMVHNLTREEPYWCHLFYHHPQVTYMMVSETFHDPVSPAQKIHIRFILFAFTCSTYVSTWLVFSNDTDSLCLLYLLWFSLTEGNHIFQMHP